MNWTPPQATQPTHKTHPTENTFCFVLCCWQHLPFRAVIRVSILLLLLLLAVVHFLKVNGVDDVMLGGRCKVGIVSQLQLKKRMCEGRCEGGRGNFQQVTNPTPSPTYTPSHKLLDVGGGLPGGDLDE